MQEGIHSGDHFLIISNLLVKMRKWIRVGYKHIPRAKVIAKELNISILLYYHNSQEEWEQNEDKTPNFLRLKELNPNRQDADMVILLYMEEKKAKNKKTFLTPLQQ